MAHRIQALIGASEPSFRTGDRRWMGLDTLLWETVHKLEAQGLELNPVVVKATVQLSRLLVSGPEALQGPALIARIALELRHRRVILPEATVRAILIAYLAVIAELEIQEINDFI